MRPEYPQSAGREESLAPSVIPAEAGIQSYAVHTTVPILHVFKKSFVASLQPPGPQSWGMVRNAEGLRPSARPNG
jgi:hypothetical protein